MKKSVQRGAERQEAQACASEWQDVHALDGSGLAEHSFVEWFYSIMRNEHFMYTAVQLMSAHHHFQISFWGGDVLWC